MQRDIPHQLDGLAAYLRGTCAALRGLGQNDQIMQAHLEQMERWAAGVDAVRMAAYQEAAALASAPAAEPVAHPVIAGAMFDFLGYLTTSDRRWVFSAADEASPAVEALQEWAKRRGLSLDGAKVADWQLSASHPQAQRAEGWISIADRLPAKHIEVLIAFDGISIPSTGQYTDHPGDRNGWCYPSENRGCCDDHSDPVVTHWMPLPAAPGAAAAAPSRDAEDAAKWREHVGKLDALVAFCPTCCEGKAASADMTRDEVIFQCGRTSGKSEAARAAQAQGGTPNSGGALGGRFRVHQDPATGSLYGSLPKGGD